MYSDMVSVWISQENALVQILAPNGTFFVWEMIKKAHHQHKSIKFNFDFTKSFEYSDEWPTNPGISDTPEMHRAKGFLCHSSVVHSWQLSRGAKENSRLIQLQRSGFVT